MKKLKNNFFQIGLYFPIFFLLNSIYFGQSYISESNESLLRVKNEIIKNEIASFAAFSSSTTYLDSLPKVKLKNIRFKDCTFSTITFEQSSIISTDKFIRIITEKFDTAKHKLTFSDNVLSLIDNKPFLGTSGSIPQRKVSAINYYLHNDYFSVIFPDSVFDGLYGPMLCLDETFSNKKPVTNCKVFQSKDKERLYIYMLNGAVKSRYEVTWVIENQKYLMRVIDKVADENLHEH